MKGKPMKAISPMRSKSRIWRGRIEAQACSGKSISVFCEDQSLTVSTFHYWKKKLGGLRTLETRESVGRFIKVMSRGHGAGLPRIHLPNGVRIELMAGLESACVTRLILSLCGANGAKP